MIDKLERATTKLRNAIRELHRTEVRDERGEFLVEGPHACYELLSGGLLPHVAVITEDVPHDVLAMVLQAQQRGTQVVKSSPSELERMVTTRTAQGIVMVMPQFDERPLAGRIIALDGVSDPGNVGTIIRTAVWFGCTDVILSHDCADVYNPKVVRSTAGALAAVNIIRRVQLAELLTSMPEVEPLIAVAEGGLHPKDLTLPMRWCLVIGSEAHGVSETVRSLAQHRLTVPRVGSGVESLNAAVAASILLYELAGRG
jgi:TrmH family RNA methyltransferase